MPSAPFPVDAVRDLIERAACKVDRLADWQEHKVLTGRPDVAGAPALRVLATEIRALKPNPLKGTRPNDCR